MRKWLKEKRLEEKLTQEEVAIKADIARTTYAAYEQGERDPSVGVAKRIGNVMNFPWTLFFEVEVHDSRTKEVG